MFRDYRPSTTTEGASAKSFTLKDQEGRAVSLSDFRGKFVLLNFWATTCAPCVSEMADLEKLYQHFKEDRFVVLGVSLDDEGWGPVNEFLKKVPLSFPILWDEKFSVADLYGTYRIPETYLIDPEGRIVEKILGAQDWANADQIQKIEKILSRP